MPLPISAVENIYLELRAMCIDFRIKPSQRINESRLAKSLNTSRTPLREGLNRLQSDGFVTHSHGDGFFGRCLNTQTMENLLQMRFGLTRIAMDIGSGGADFDMRAEVAEFWYTVSDAYYAGADPDVLIEFEDLFDRFILSSVENPVCADMFLVCADQTRMIRKALLHINPVLALAFYQKVTRDNGQIQMPMAVQDRQFLNDAVNATLADIHAEGGT